MGRKKLTNVNYTGYIKITSIPLEIKAVLENIAQNNNMDMSKLLRPVLREFIEKQPERLKQKPLSY